MGRFVTPQGVVVQLSDEAAAAVGYKPAAAGSKPDPAPRRSRKKSEKAEKPDPETDPETGPGEGE